MIAKTRSYIGLDTVLMAFNIRVENRYVGLIKRNESYG